MSLTDRHHFDNPVYCYPTGGANGGVGGATAAVGGLNNARIRNDLGCPGTKSNLTNLERAKLGPNSLDDDCSEGIVKIDMATQRRFVFLSEKRVANL